MIIVRHRGDLKQTKNFLDRMKERSYLKNLEKYAQEGVAALSAATPVDTGKTANSWTYEIEHTDTRYAIYWINTNENKGVNIALILQTGHGTGSGGYVQGIDYINPAMKPILQKIADEAWKEVTSS